jgi:hypothetical protein
VRGRAFGAYREIVSSATVLKFNFQFNHVILSPSWKKLAELSNMLSEAAQLIFFPYLRPFNCMDTVTPCIF